MVSSDGRDTLIADRGGTYIGVLIPPSNDGKINDHIAAKLRSLQAVANRTAGERRGSFKVVCHGIQMGAGNKV